MSIRYGFFDNQLIGVDELKDITKGIQSNGISIDENQMAVSDLNQFYEKIFTTGVVPDTDTSLFVKVSGTTITVAPGTAYFENGTFITVIEAETLTRISGAVNYVYAVSDRDKGEAYIEVFTGTKEDDVNGGMYYVPLAEISADAKTVTDKRVYATSALAANPPANASGNYFADFALDGYEASTGTQKRLFIKINPAEYKYLQLKWDKDERRRNFLQYEISDGQCKLIMSVGNRRASYMSWDNEPYICSGYDNQENYWKVAVEKIDTSGIILLFTAQNGGASGSLTALTFNLSLIRKEMITDETTVTVE